jgi:preprotein translocase subunit SecA
LTDFQEVKEMAYPQEDDKGGSSKVVKVELKNFMASDEAEALETKHQDYLDTVVRAFLECVYIYHDTAPIELDASELRSIVLETLPRCFSGKEDYLSAVPEIVGGYIDYLENAELANDPKGLDKVMTEMKKKFTRTAKKVKPDDRLYSETGGQQIKRDDGKVGRNDPCPCGSGKKYKKCCLSK